MSYAINIESESGRILSATFPRYGNKNSIIVDKLPDGILYDYRYADGEFIYDPLPVEETTKLPTTEERLEAVEAALLEIITGGVTV